MTAIAGAGLLCSMLMKDVPLHTVVDMKWALEAKNAVELSPMLNPQANESVAQTPSGTQAESLY